MKFFFALLATNLKASFALRAAFWMQAAFMALNNVLFFTVWWILFDRFDEINGYRVEDMAALYGVAATAYGFAAILAGALPELGRKIEDGELDSMLTQPKSVLVQAVSCRTRPDGWGDVVSGAFLIAISGYVGFTTWPVAVLAVVLSTVMFIAAGIMIHSAAFFLNRVGGLARQVTEFLVTFAVYPPTLFGGALKVFLFTVLPAGLISYLPVQLLREFDPQVALLAVGGTAVYSAVALVLFHRGLRFYASGNRL